MNQETDKRKFLVALLSFALGVLFMCGAFPVISHANEGILVASLFGSDKGPAPDFELKDLNGSSVRLSRFKGDRPVLLYFWATWCPHCIAARPQVARLRESTGSSTVEILAINVGDGDSLEKLRRYQEAHPVKYPVLYDGDGKVSQSYQVRGIPLFVLVDKDGSIVYRGSSVPDPVRYLK